MLSYTKQNTASDSHTINVKVSLFSVVPQVKVEPQLIGIPLGKKTTTFIPVEGGLKDNTSRQLE
jgi:hypothetical protein